MGKKKEEVMQMTVDSESSQPTEVEAILDTLPKEGEPIIEEAKVEEIPEEKVEPKKEIPWHKNPRWQRMEQENKELKGNLEQMRSELEGLKTAKNPQEIPSWFQQIYGNNPSLWTEYQHYSSQQQAEIQEAISQRVKQELIAQEQQKLNEKKHIEEWLEGQFQELESEGASFSRDELKKVMEKYSPVDENGNLDFRKGHEILTLLNAGKAQAAKTAAKGEARKEIAAQTVKGTTGVPKRQNVDLNMIRKFSFHDLARL